MPIAPRERNRGPAAAAANREALLAAARRLFAERGLRVPLSAIAREAGVGQGVLYRHFPTRLDLAIAVFEENLVVLDALAGDPDADLDDLLALITEQTLDSVAFIELIDATTEHPRLAEVSDRVRAGIEAKVPEARAAGRLRGDMGADAVLLAISMLANMVARVPADHRRRTAVEAWRVLLRGLVPDTPSSRGRRTVRSPG